MNNNSKSKLSISLYKILPLASILYLSFISIIPRNTNLFIEKVIIEKEKNKTSLSMENYKQKKLRHKLSQDFKYHEINKNWYKKSLSKVALNKEGKIIGYKIINIFYPNYFTKSQIRNIIKKSRTFPYKKTNLKIVKIYFTK